MFCRPCSHDRFEWLNGLIRVVKLRIHLFHCSLIKVSESVKNRGFPWVLGALPIQQNSYFILCSVSCDAQLPIQKDLLTFHQYISCYDFPKRANHYAGIWKTAEKYLLVLTSISSYSEFEQLELFVDNSLMNPQPCHLLVLELSSSSYEFLRVGAAKGCFPGDAIRLVLCVCSTYIVCCNVKTCIRVPTAGRSINPSEVAAHHLPRSG